MRGLITKSISGEYAVTTDELKTYICKPKGLFRHTEQSPKVGDKVVFEEKTKTITEILPRRNELTRPFVSNVDKMFLIVPVKEPDLNLNLLDRMLSITEYNQMISIIVFSKIDLLENLEEITKIKDYYSKIGYSVYLTGKNIDNTAILAEFKNSISVLAGQSGAGKSSLLNMLSDDLNLKTQEISFALGRGKHTTRHTELHYLNEGWIADTPGFGTVDFPFDDLLSYSHSFIEFFDNSSKCKFSRCLHIKEPGCEVKRLVLENEILKSRYGNYSLFFEEIDELIKNKY